MNKLAIIIPAYKINYLDEAILSLVNQSEKKFTLYVCDDFGPSQIKEICSKYIDKLDLVYHRFNENLGGINLVEQWNRCVSITRKEEWIWLFSDDDIADFNCVEQLYFALEKTNFKYDIYRFNTRVINKNSEILNENPESPEFENSMNLAYNILMLRRGNCMPDQIVRRKTYYDKGGYINFKFGQASDWATAIDFSYIIGIFTIDNAKISWRTSGENLSSMAYIQKYKMIYGHLEFINWINSKFTIYDESVFNFPLSKIKEASIYNLEMILKNHYAGIPVFEFFKISKLIAISLKWNMFKACLLILKIQIPISFIRLKSKFFHLSK